jgi:hypothetical protein
MYVKTKTEENTTALRGELMKNIMHRVSWTHSSASIVPVIKSRRIGGRNISPEKLYGNSQT